MRYLDLITESELEIFEHIDSLHEDVSASVTDQVILAQFEGRNDVLEKLFRNRDLPVGTVVTVRQNLNSKFSIDGRPMTLQTVHNGKSPKGIAIGFDLMVTLTDATFIVSQAARSQIAQGKSSKFPMAGVAGRYSHGPHDVAGVEIRFNPRNDHLFTRADNGYAVKSASEVTVFNTRVYARGNIEYWDERDAPKALNDVPSNVLFKSAEN